MIETLTGTHADWVVAIARIVLGIIFFWPRREENVGFGMAGKGWPAACAHSPNICIFRRLWPFL
jgi:hypothetical protein